MTTDRINNNPARRRSFVVAANRARLRGGTRKSVSALHDEELGSPTSDGGLQGACHDRTPRHHTRAHHTCRSCSMRYAAPQTQ